MFNNKFLVLTIGLSVFSVCNVMTVAQAYADDANRDGYVVIENAYHSQDLGFTKNSITPKHFVSLQEDVLFHGKHCYINVGGITYVIHC